MFVTKGCGSCPFTCARSKDLDTGCNECAAKPAAQVKACSGRTPSRVVMRWTLKFSSVNVPVLSKMTVSTLANICKACKRLSNTPPLANAPAVANMAAGVAKDNAQGQVTMSTETATIRACAGLCCQPHRAAKPAAKSTPHKNGLATLSAIKAMLGLDTEALSIKATI